MNRRTLALPALLGLALIPWAAGAALGPRYGGELAVAVAELPESLEPGVPRGAAEGLLAALVHETLVAGGPDGVPVPRLARGWASGAGGRDAVTTDLGSLSRPKSKSRSTAGASVFTASGVSGSSTS